MYFPTSTIRKRFVSLLVLIQYTVADNSPLQAVYQENSLASSSVTLDDSLLAFSGVSEFTTPYTSSSASSEPATNPSDPRSNPQNNNGPEPLLLSNQDCHSAAEQTYPSRRRRKRQNEKTFCDNPTPGTSNQLENNNGKINPNSPTQNSVPNPNGHDKIPTKVQAPVPEPNERVRFFLYSMPGWDGEPNPTACNNPDYPLIQVPICAPPAPPSVRRISPAEFVVPCKLLPLEGCNRATEEFWCCLMARETDHMYMSAFLPPGQVIPDTIVRYPASGLSFVQVFAAGT